MELKKKDRHIIRKIVEENWKHDGFIGKGNKKRKTYECKLCGAA